MPSRERQAERLGPKFEALAAALEERRIALTGDAAAVEPERVVVLETVAPVERFVTATRRIRGIEWLAEIDDPEIPPDDDFFDEERPDTTLHGRLYVTFLNQQALQELLSLWKRHLAGAPPERGFAPFAELFKLLREIRPWDARDRLESTGVLANWRERVAAGQERVRCEIELWYRRNPGARYKGAERIRERVEAAGGTILERKTLEAIAYHALLAELPIAEVERIIATRDTVLVQCEDVRLFGATGQMAVSATQAELERDEVPAAAGEPLLEPVAALFDGMPLQRHRRLEGRLVVDDPDEWETSYPADARVHGTSMASLILHGDLASDLPPSRHRLYVRPIMRPADPTKTLLREAVPEDGLLVDLVHRAVIRMVAGEGDEPPTGDDVRIVNLSIGDLDRTFDRVMSPLARLLDYLAYRYQLLFIVSAGNCAEPLRLNGVDREEDLPATSREQLQVLTLRAIAADPANRRLLSPAEAMNVLTVAAAHDDASVLAPPPRWLDPYHDSNLPSPLNRQGMGYRRNIKPDVLMSGGRVPLGTTLLNSSGALSVFHSTRAPGVRAAAPGPAPGDGGGTQHVRGTSVAAALTTRAAVRLHDVLEELREQPRGDSVIDAVPRAVWIRTLLAHSAHWSSEEAVARALLTEERKGDYREYITRLLGYGVIDSSRLGGCDDYRVTAIGGGTLPVNGAQDHRFPLPPSLSGRVDWRRLTITLSYFTPVNPFHQAWRRAHLWFSPPTDELEVRRTQAAEKATKRGTLQHEVLEGTDATAYVDGTHIVIPVSCRADAGRLTESIPYALAVTLEVSESIGVPIYEEVRDLIQVPIKSRSV